MEKKLQKQYPTNYNSFRALVLWQAHYQVLLIILLNEFIKLNVNTNKMIKNVKLEELNTKIASASLKTQALKMI